MSKIFFTSDWHFGHNRDFIYLERRYNSFQEHDQSIIEKHNSIVSKDDTVYVLGDLCLGDLKYGLNCIKQMNGHLHIICGNHDTEKRIKAYKELDNVESVLYADLIKYKKYIFYLSHYPTYIGNYDLSMSREWCLHGHTHSKYIFSEIDKNYNVNMDAHQCYPIEIEQICQDIHEQWNFINKENDRKDRITKIIKSWENEK